MQCPCGRRVGCVHAYENGRRVVVPAMHQAPHDESGRSRVCPHAVDIYEALDPVLPWPLNTPQPHRVADRLERNEWRRRLYATVPAILGGPCEAPVVGF